MISNLLIFFAIPLAVVLISIALQKILRNPFLVAGIVFSVLLVIVLAFFDTIYLVAVVAYSILSFVTAILTCLLCRVLNNTMCNCMGNNNQNDDDTTDETLINHNLIEGTTLNNDGRYGCNSNGFYGTTGSYSRKYSGKYRR
ncbi:MAG: YbeF family protein [Clostridia bacterium]|nr:YbeF family protein [Clostridia bacterium]